MNFVKDVVPKGKDVKKYLVIVVDMDDDIGRKGNIRTPILGMEDNINAAVKLGLADPGDSDVNSILGGVKLYDELKKEGKDVEIATISGDKDVESERCAMRIKEQLDFLMYLYEPTFIYLVSDGKEDELVLKYLESNEVFVWKKRIVVKQNESLESTYYLIQEFIKKTMSQYVPFLFTSVGFAMILYAVFADLGWRIIAGLIGLYILSEGVSLTETLKKSFKEGKEGIEVGKLTPIGNAISSLIIIVGIIYSYKMSAGLELVKFVGTFLNYMANPLALGLFIFVTIRFIDDIIHTSKNVLSLLKRIFFKIIVIFMAREILMIFSMFLIDESVKFANVMVYVIAYTSILIIISAILFYEPKSESGDKVESQTH
ncbi:MAG: putative rane protein [Methanothermococcus sp.]|nr:putative rane protein [Methanothermococcus sp.]